MPKPVLFEPPKPRKKKRKKRKVDYTELLAPPVIPNTQCPHTRKAQDASSCSQCMLVQPSVVHKPITREWWADDEELEISIEEIARKLGTPVIELDNDNGFIDLKPDDD